MDIKTLVQGFARNIRQLKAPEYKESQLRLHYLDPFWTLLGWDVTNNEQRAPQDVDVVVEPSMDSVEDDGLRAREPDYLFRVSGFSRFIVEAKKPAVDIETDKKAIFQTKRYAWSATIPFAILTDFEQFRLYDTTFKPILNEPSRGLIKDYVVDFQDYPSKWEEIVATFGRDAVSGGSLERLRAKLRKLSAGRRVRTVDRMLYELRGDEPVDRVFLEYLERYRKQFAQVIYHDNKKDFPEADTIHGAAKLTEAVQRLIDRLVFMRVCEDRGIVPWGGMRDTLERISTEGGELYPSLCAEFEKWDRNYNGYLFKYHFSKELNVSGDALADFIRTLYPPEGPWNFSAIGDDILGIVYERFLGNLVTVKRGVADVEEKPEVRHAGGVYYTPRFVVDTIIRRTVGAKIAGKTPVQILDVKVLDPACGSGSFLVAAFQYLIDHCLSAIATDPNLASVPLTPRARKKRKEIAFKDKNGQWHLAPDFKAALLTSCIHGVDIDQQAMEVTVMSLYLKMLEGAMPPNWQREWLESQLLPPLDNNILCGNSLIDNADFDHYRSEVYGGLLLTLDDDDRFRINRFDWKSRMRGFGRLLDAQAARERGRAGFDCIIGNPPYIRVQELNQWAPEECEFYKFRYGSAKKGNYDIYVVFTERCLELLAPDGLLGFIMPHKFWQANYGAGLRNVISAGKNLQSVIDFKQEQVFHGATTYTAIHVFSKNNPNETVSYSAVSRLVDGVQQMTAIAARAQTEGIEYATSAHPTGAAWSFVANEARVSWRITTSGVEPLHALARLAQGIKTSADKIFVVDVRKIDNDFSVIISAQTGREHRVETKVLWPLIKSEHMKRFVVEESRKALLFPYELLGHKYSPMKESRWQQEFPEAWKYLTELKKILEAREKGRMVGRPDWFAYIYPKNFAVMAKPKLVIPDICEHMQVCIDGEGKYIFSGGAAGGNAIVPHDQSQVYYLAGILNSQLIEKHLRQTGTKFRGGYLNCEIRFIKDLPIKLPTTPAEEKLAERVVESVSAITGAKVKLQGASLSDRDRTSLESEVESHEQRINEAVLRLYGVKELPA